MTRQITMFDKKGNVRPTSVKSERTIRTLGAEKGVDVLNTVQEVLAQVSTGKLNQRSINSPKFSKKTGQQLPRRVTLHTQHLTWIQKDRLLTLLNNRLGENRVAAIDNAVIISKKNPPVNKVVITLNW